MQVRTEVEKRRAAFEKEGRNMVANSAGATLFHWVPSWEKGPKRESRDAAE
jgi:hypothetical protein